MQLTMFILYCGFIFSNYHYSGSTPKKKKKNWCSSIASDAVARTAMLKQWSAYAAYKQHNKDCQR